MAHPTLNPSGWAQREISPEQAVAAAEALRVALPGEVDPTPDHWKNLNLSLFQHAVLQNPHRPELEHHGVLSPAALHEFSHLITSIPFFFPVQIPCVKKDPVASLLYLIW